MSPAKASVVLGEEHAEIKSALTGMSASFKSVMVDSPRADEKDVTSPANKSEAEIVAIWPHVSKDAVEPHNGHGAAAASFVVTSRSMSALGQTFAVQNDMSALPRKQTYAVQ
jgi:hypothetical protein